MINQIRNEHLCLWIKVIFITIGLTYSNIIQASLSDDFNSNTTELNPAVWRFYDPYDTDTIPGNESGESILTYSGSNALISIPAGLQHDLWAPPSNKAPRLLQPTSNTDFGIEVKFETTPNEETQTQGIIVQQNDDIFLRFDIYYTPAGPRLFTAFVDGTTSTIHKSISLQYYPKYLRVIRSGDQWTFRYSSDGSTTWTDAVIFTQNLVVTEVGVFAGTAGSNPNFLSSIDYFNNLANPIPDIDVWLAPPPEINAWYGYTQPFSQFGLPGTSQQWANILGNVFSDLEISTLTYKINGGLELSLPFGYDQRRLDRDGDFNIEIAPTSLINGPNSIEIKATDINGLSTSKVVIIDYSSLGSLWPLPYLADWGTTNIEHIESIAHIVDGLWELTPTGIRTVQSGYDRAIAIGDMNWSSDYEVTVPITIHSGFSGIGFAVGWQGHDGIQTPRIEWPLQALAWIRGPINSATLEIITYGGLTGWEVIQTPDPQYSVSITMGETYTLKTRSESVGNGMSIFYVKFWPENTAEPIFWNINADIPTRDGSVLLVAYKADVTFGNVSIEPISVLPDITPPVISNIQTVVTDTTAIITWDTDEVSDSRIDYGLTTGYGSAVNDIALVTTHSLTLTGLTPDTLYHYQISSVDGSSNMTSNVDLTLTTDTITDTTPPVISNIQVTAITGTSAIISWETDEDSDSTVRYGLDNTYALPAISDNTLITLHSITLTGLSIGTEYHYQINSIDASSNSVSSPIDLVFTTSTIDSGGDLVAHWLLDEGIGTTASDNSGNGHDGVLTNNPVWNGSELLLDGVDDYVNVGTLDVPGTTLTLAGWVQADSLENCTYLDCRIFSKAMGTSEQDHYWMVSTINTGGAIRLRFRLKAGGSTSTLIATSGDLFNGDFFHFAAVYDGITMRLYKDGVEVGNLAKTGNIDTNTGVETWIGGNPPTATARPWKGSMTDVRVYQTALTVTEVNTIKDSYTISDTTPPVISNIQVTPLTDTSTIISWETDENADSTVRYGPDNTYTLPAISNNTLTTLHSITLTGLNVNTEYHYQVNSVDTSGNSSSSLTDLVFTNIPGSTSGAELLMFDWNTVVTTANHGFPRNKPPLASANGDWTTPINYADGTLYLRAEIKSGGQPVPQTMFFNYCVWQKDLVTGNNTGLEICTSVNLGGPLQGIPGEVLTWSQEITNMPQISQDPIDWTRPRSIYGIAIKNSSKDPVSDYKNWNWFGENPDEWYPLDARFTAVVVPLGKTFSGWNNYIN